MTTVHQTSNAPKVHRGRPFAAALTGAAVFAVTMTAGEVLDLNADSPDAPPTSVGEIFVYAAIVLAAVALATWLGGRALAGTPDRLARYSLGLAIGAGVTFIAFWSGWPHVLGATAVMLAFEHRRRIGGFSAMTATAAGIGAVALVAAAYVCVTG
jgi:hypothetical protein